MTDKDKIAVITDFCKALRDNRGKRYALCLWLDDEWDERINDEGLSALAEAFVQDGDFVAFMKRKEEADELAWQQRQREERQVERLAATRIEALRAKDPKHVDVVAYDARKARSKVTGERFAEMIFKPSLFARLVMEREGSNQDELIQFSVSADNLKPQHTVEEDGTIRVHIGDPADV